MGYYQVEFSRIPVGDDQLYADARSGRLCVGGFEMARMPSDDKIRAYYEGGESGLIWLRVEDNGEHGDGINVSVGCDLQKKSLVWMQLPDSSARILHAALGAIFALRQSAKEQEEPC